MSQNHPRSAYFGPWRDSKDCTVTLEYGPSPSALRGSVATVGGGLASAFKPCLRLRLGPPSGVVLLMVVLWAANPDAGGIRSTMPMGQCLGQRVRWWQGTTFE